MNGKQGQRRGRRIATPFAGLIAVAGVVAALAVAGQATASGAPETPITEACSPRLSPNEICGTLNPGSNSRVGYYFAVNVGSSCTGGDQIAGEEVEGQNVQVSADPAGLQPDTTYSYCLVAVSEEAQAVGLALTFHTAPRTPEPPETPVTETCLGQSVPGHVCGTLNPGSATKVGYYFIYNAGANCAGGTETAHQPEVAGVGIPVDAQLSGLMPGTIYSYCLVAENQDGKASGESISFATPPTPVDPGTGIQPLAPPATTPGLGGTTPTSGCRALSGAGQDTCERLRLALQKSVRRQHQCKAKEGIERKRCISANKRRTQDLRRRYHQLTSGNP